MKISFLNHAANWLASYNLKETFEEIIVCYRFFEKCEKNAGKKCRTLYFFTIFADELPSNFPNWGRNEWRDFLKNDTLEATDNYIPLGNIIDIDLRVIYIVYRDKDNNPIFFAHDLQKEYCEGNGWIIYNQLAASLSKKEAEKIHEKADVERVFAKIRDDRKIPTYKPEERINCQKDKNFITYPEWPRLFEKQ